MESFNARSERLLKAFQSPEWNVDELPKADQDLWHRWVTAQEYYQKYGRTKKKVITMLVNTFSEKNKKYSRDRARKDLDNAIRLYGMNFKKHKDAERHLYVEKLRLIQKKLEKAKKWKELALYMGLELKACAYDNHDEQFEPMPIPDIILQPGNPKDDQLPPTDMRSLGRVLKRDKEIFTMGMQRLVEYIDAEDIEGTEIQE